MSSESLTDQIARTLVGGISPGILPEGQHAARLEEYRRMAREDANPFPLVAMQWPELLIDDPEDAQYFKGTIGDPLDPALRLDDWQRMVLVAVFDPTIREIYEKGCTGAGKGGSMAMATNLLYDVYDEVRIHITSESFSHACRNFYGEVRMWRERMRFPAAGNVNTSSIAASQRRYITVLNPRPGQAGESFSGQHGANTIYIFDEGTSAEQVWLENAAKNAKKIFVLANPRTLMGPFRNAFKPLLAAGKDENKTGVCYGVLGRRLCVTISGLDCANVKHGRLKDAVAPLGGITIDGVKYEAGTTIPPHHYAKVRPLIPGQIDLNQYRAIVEKSDEPWKVRCFAHGMFPDELPENQIFMSGWFARHTAAWHAAEKGFSVPVNAFGLDVARSLAGDYSCLTAGSGVGIAMQHKERLGSYPEIAAWVLTTARDQHGLDITSGNYPVCIDYAGGFGSGVGDWLRMHGVWVIECFPSASAFVVPQVYMNLRTEMYALLGRRLSPHDQWADDPFAIPDDNELQEDLLAATRKWRESDYAKFIVVPKDVIKENLGRSPDKGDSAALLFMAVREQEQLNDYFAMTAGELIAQAGGAEYKAREDTGKMNPRNPSQQLSELVDWMKRRQRGGG